MKFQNNNTSFWDMAYSGSDIRTNKCLPEKMVVEATCCACADQIEIKPTVPWEEFKYCRPLDRDAGIAATDCRPEEQSFAKPEPRVILPAACRANRTSTP